MVLQAISGAKAMGAAKIIGIDKNEKKREKGEAFGMNHFINPSDSAKSVSELVKEATGGMGVDYSFECTGIPPMLTESLEATKMVIFIKYLFIIVIRKKLNMNLSFPLFVKHDKIKYFIKANTQVYYFKM